MDTALKLQRRRFIYTPDAQAPYCTFLLPGGVMRIPVFQGCDPGMRMEVAAEMALVGETRGQSNVNGRAAIPQQFLGEIDPDLHQVRVRRHTYMLPEGPQKMERAQSGNGRELRQGNIALVVGLQIFARMFNSGTLTAELAQ